VYPELSIVVKVNELVVAVDLGFIRPPQLMVKGVELTA
jgi:hypothetical protein